MEGNKMEEKTNGKEQPFRPESMDLSKMSVDQLKELKEAIMARAGEKVGPEGFSPIMMQTGGDIDSFSTVSQPWDYLSQVINIAFRRIALSLTTVGLGLTAANLYGTQGGAAYAPAALVGAGVSAAWFILDMVRGGVKGRE
jgi:hypothetical protein